MKIVLVGERWGRNEAKFSHPLVGPSGRELTLELAHAGMAPFMRVLCRKCRSRSQFIDTRCENCKEFLWPNEFDLIDHWKFLKTEHQIAVTNVFNAMPPNNDLGTWFGTERQTPMQGWRPTKTAEGSHLKAEHFHHIETLWRNIQDWQPTLVVALGNAATWAIVDQTKIYSLRGTTMWSERLNVKVLATFNPANVIRPTGRSMRPTVITDLTKATREAQFPEIRRPERWIIIPEPTAAGIQEGYNWFSRPATAYANDIETFAGQITIVGFARSKDDALVIPIRNTDFDRNLAEVGPNYWPTEALEVEAWKLIRFGLQTPQAKIFQNGMYDISYYVKNRLFPRNVLHDTMLWHHSLYPEMPKSLGYLGSIYANDVSWKMMRRRESLKRDE